MLHKGKHHGPGPDPGHQHHTAHAHVHKGHQREHAAEHHIQVHGAAMAEHSGLLGHAGDSGPAESHTNEHYRERHELHHNAHPGEGFMGREGSKRHAARSMKTNRFT
jgi:hypothetical protein